MYVNGREKGIIVVLQIFDMLELSLYSAFLGRKSYVLSVMLQYLAYTRRLKCSVFKLETGSQICDQDDPHAS